MKTDFMVFADAAAVTQEGKLVIHGIFTQIGASALPAAHPAMVVAFRLDGVPPKTAMTFRLRDVMGEKVVSKLALPETGEANRKKTGGILNLVGLRFEHYGAYVGELLVGGEVTATSEFLVHKTA